MYAIFRDGSRQFQVSEGDEVVVDFRDAPSGARLVFESVLAVGTGAGLQLGKPLLAGVKVEGEVLGPEQGPKLVVQKMRRRKNSRRKTGHRQLSTLVKITKIEGAA